MLWSVELFMCLLYDSISFKYIIVKSKLNGKIWWINFISTTNDIEYSNSDYQFYHSNI